VYTGEGRNKLMQNSINIDNQYYANNSGSVDGFGYNPHMINNGVRKPPMTF
jgi:hypothetical protein